MQVKCVAWCLLSARAFKLCLVSPTDQAAIVFLKSLKAMTKAKTASVYCSFIFLFSVVIVFFGVQIRCCVTEMSFYVSLHRDV